MASNLHQSCASVETSVSSVKVKSAHSCVHRFNIWMLSFVLLLQVTEMENEMSPVQEDEGPNAVSQLARKVRGR